MYFSHSLLAGSTRAVAVIGCAGGSARTTKGPRGPKGPRTSKGTEGNQGGEDYYDGPLWLVDPFEGTGSIFLDVW